MLGEDSTKKKLYSCAIWGATELTLKVLMAHHLGTRSMGNSRIEQVVKMKSDLLTVTT